jgi:hypothetical protein
MLSETVREARRCRILGRRTREGALDSTGFEAHHVSHYFVRRRSRGDKRLQDLTYAHFPKSSLLVDCASHFILAAEPGRGPSPDQPCVIPTMLAACARQRIDTLFMDAGHDGEWVHEFSRNELDVRSIIPPTIGRPTEKPPRTRYRRAMRAYFRRPARRRRYGQRWQVETVVSMIKRRLGEGLGARSERRQNQAMMLRAIVHNILILLVHEVFYRARMSPFRP